MVIPHDAVLAMARVPDAHQMASGYFPGGKWEYRTRIFAPAHWRDRHVVLEFEAIHRSAAVFVNGDLAIRQPSGSTSLVVELDAFLRYGVENEIVVEARADRDARWYTGGGIIRPVHLAVGPRVHVPLDGVVVTTPEHDAEASLVQIITTVRNLESVPVVRWLETSITSPSDDLVGVDRTRVSVPAGGEAEVSQRMLVEAPLRWSVDSPDLYRVTSRLTSGAGGEGQTDHGDVLFGVRSLHLDARRGLRVNGQPVKLRGACVHADNGVIGGATFDAAEERRVAILKSAGFNAIRSAHQPMSRAMLDACDRLGMLVMDELTDVWTRAKSPEDGSDVFLERWRSDLEAMVRKDRNHPCVIIYSIGNEIPEAATRSGSELTRALAAATRALDPTRYVTAAVNGALFVMDGAIDIDPERLGGASLDPVAEINARSMSLEDRMSSLALTDAVAELTEEAYGALDIAGMNYQDARYVLDHERYPHRVIVGSETFPTRIDRLWGLVLANPHVIGDFTWTGWDYLGEPGLGRMHYRDDQPGSGALGAYPFLISLAGDIDITGERRPASYYREIVFGLRAEPFIAVRRPHTRGREMKAAPWSWTDSIQSWTWPDAGTDPLEVEIYCDAAEVELFVAGSSLGRQPAGASHGYRALFAVPYAPGRLEAVALRDGLPAERAALQTAGTDRRLALRAKLSTPDTGGQRLAFVVVELVDDVGVRATDGDLEVEVDIDGPGELQGFGSARPETEESFSGSRHRLYDGRALAVVRPTGAGRIVVIASAPGLPSASVEVQAV
ncbi:glycoside hydrolase family 2 TIM barrel-domain containing protein [Microbacterium murale]|uniref:glycoside hydrolase family 2 TIM barrel-domain containing protein n=1 Tax=Microbacterium murale TaxID=1081040 RepID=UPI0027D927C4|nr:glycoside hydrolase family 2 TIM barrel-domain containing protein [Microbacterium murale]